MIWESEQNGHCALKKTIHISYFKVFYAPSTKCEFNVAVVQHASTYYHETFARTVSCVKQQQQHLPQRYLIQAHLTDGHKASEVVYTAYIKKKMGEGRLAA